jgi:hypothetical protein
MALAAALLLAGTGKVAVAAVRVDEYSRGAGSCSFRVAVITDIHIGDSLADVI